MLGYNYTVQCLDAEVEKNLMRLPTMTPGWSYITHKPLQNGIQLDTTLDGQIHCSMKVW